MATSISPLMRVFYIHCQSSLQRRSLWPNRSTFSTVSWFTVHTFWIHSTSKAHMSSLYSSYILHLQGALCLLLFHNLIYSLAASFKNIGRSHFGAQKKCEPGRWQIPVYLRQEQLIGVFARLDTLAPKSTDLFPHVRWIFRLANDDEQLPELGHQVVHFADHLQLHTRNHLLYIYSPRNDWFLRLRAYTIDYMRIISLARSSLHVEWIVKCVGVASSSTQ